MQRTSIIRNPARKIVKVQNKIELQPEHKRLGIKSNELVSKIDQSDFRYAAEKRIQAAKKEEIHINTPNSIKKNFPAQLKVGNISGFTQEATWRPREETENQNVIEAWEDNKEKSFEQLEQEEGKLKEEIFSYDEIETETEKTDMQDICKSNDYVVLYNEKIIFYHSDLNKVELFIENLLFDENSEYQDIKIDDILVFKRMILKAGVILR